jgi:hypothetical protein
MIEALDARTPQQAGYNNDNRLLGASLEWIEAS